MYQNIKQQKEYWNKEVNNFDSIYSHKKSKFKNFLDKKLRWDMYERLNYTMRNSEPIIDKSILDIGCGTGRFVFEFLQRNAKKVVGIDIAPNMIKTCQQVAEEKKVTDRCEFYVADPFEFNTDLKFDISIGIGLFDYIIDSLSVIKRMKEFTTDRIIISFPRKWSIRALIRKIRLTLKGCDVYFYTIPEIDKILKDAGFQKYELEKVGQLYCITACC